MRYLISLLFGLMLALGSPSVSQAAVIGGGQEFGPTNVTANNTDFFTLDTVKYSAVIVRVSSVGGGATISWQGSNDSAFGGTLIALPGMPSAGGASVTSTTAVGHWVIAPTTRYLRVRTTAYTSGTITVSATAVEKESPIEAVWVAGGSLGTNQSTNLAQLAGNTVSTGNGTSGTGVLRVALASDQTTNTNPLLVGGTGATSIGKAEDAAAASGDTGVPLWSVRRDAATQSASAAGDYSESTANRFGALYTAGFRTHTRTYSATHNITVAASATDIAWFPGNGTTTVQVTKIRISGIQTTTGTPEVLLILRSTANSGGTSTSFSVGRHEQADAANSSTPIGYTVNPTPGTSAGTIRRQYLPVGSAASALSGEVVFELGENGKPITLSGTTQGLAVNLNGVTVTGGVFNIAIEWIEF